MRKMENEYAAHTNFNRAGDVGDIEHAGSAYVHSISGGPIR